MSGKGDKCSRFNNTKMAAIPRSNGHRDAMMVHLWTDGLICAFEYVRGSRHLRESKPLVKFESTQLTDDEDDLKQTTIFKVDTPVQNGNLHADPLPLLDLRPDPVVDAHENLCGQGDRGIHKDRVSDSRWVPIGWARVSDLIKTVQVDSAWATQQFNFMDDEDDVTVAEVAAPYWERPAGPVWWCHVDASHPCVSSWLGNAQWLHPAISVALRDESRLISERMKYLLYEVPVRVAEGLLFELLGHSAGDPFTDEDDIPVVLRSWHAQNFLITAMHLKGSATNLNVLGIMEVQELLLAGGYNAPRTVQDVIAHLACRLARWDDRLFRKSIFGTADEVELKFMNRRNHEDMNLFGVILNQEIRKLSRQTRYLLERAELPHDPIGHLVLHLIKVNEGDACHPRLHILEESDISFEPTIEPRIGTPPELTR